MTRPTGLENMQDLCEIVHPDLDLVSFFGAQIFEWNIVLHNHHSCQISMIHYITQSRKYIPMRQNLILPTSSSRLNASQNRNKTQYISYRVNKTGRVDHETTNCGIVVSKSVNDTNLKHPCHLCTFFPARMKRSP